MKGETNSKSSKTPIILGRPFLKTVKTNIDVDDGTLSMFGDTTTKFKVFDVMKHPMEDHSVFQIDFLFKLVDETYSDLVSTYFPSLSDFDDTYTCDACTNTLICYVCAKIEATLQVDITTGSSIDTPICNVLANKTLNISATQNKSSIEKPHSLELKPLLEDLKYSSKLEFDQEEKLLKEIKKGIEWTLADILDISPSMCMHMISLED